jgi:RHS repeat-associated protein
MRNLTRSALVLALVIALNSTVRAGGRVEYSYDKYGNRSAVTTTNSSGQILEQTNYSYDNYRRPVEKVEAAQTGSNSRRWTWTYERYFEDDPNRPYDPYAHTSSQWRLQYEPAYDGAGHRNVTARWFDSNDRIVDEYTGVIDTPGTGLSNGPDIEVHHFTYDPNGQKETYTDPMQRVTTYLYDNRNRLHQTIEPKRADQATNPTTTVEYDFAGNKTDVTLPDTRTQHWRSYDAFGQPRQFTDERNNSTDLNYWPFGPMKKLAQVITHRTKDDGTTEDQPTSFYYDGLGRAYATVFPDQSTEWTFYELGQVERSVTRKGETKHTTYDARGREVSNYWDNQAAPGVSRSWDDANRTVSLCNIYSTIEYQYDGAGLVSSERNTVAGSGGPAVTTFSRYPNGAVSRIVYPNTLSVRRDYNSRGQMSATGWSGSNNNWLAIFATYNYLQDGKLNSQDYINGVHTAFGYDTRGVLSQETVSHGGQIYSQRTLYRDDRDRITAFQKSSNTAANPMENGHGDRFRYDDEGQLMEAWYNAADPASSGAGNNRYDGFNYDQLGNRTGANFIANHGPMTFTRKDNGLNQYRMWSPFSVTNYDDDIGGTWGTPGHANGVLMQDGNITGGYNALNQPMLITSNAVAPNWVFFGYDPLGRCVKRWVAPSPSDGSLVPPADSNPATYFYYDGMSLIQEGPRASTISQVYMLGNRVDDIVADFAVTNNQWMYHHADPRGHCMFLTDRDGTMAEQYEYDAFGYPHCYSVSNGWSSDLPYSSFSNRFLFTGREWLAELKLYDYRARMYQPELGRFMQPDPKEFAAGDYNLYRYCHNDPVNHSDPMGLAERILEDFQWKMNCFFDGGNSFEGSYAEYMNRSPANSTSMPSGNYKDPNIQNHIKKDQATPGLTELTNGNVDSGVASPTLNWWVNDERYANTKVVLGELEHVSRSLWALEKGDLGAAIRKFNANPNGDKAKDKLENALEKEMILQKQTFHGRNAQGNLRHDYSKNPELRKTMTPADIKRAIESVRPDEDPRSQYLGY